MGNSDVITIKKITVIQGQNIQVENEPNRLNDFLINRMKISIIKTHDCVIKLQRLPNQQTNLKNSNSSHVITPKVTAKQQTRSAAASCQNKIVRNNGIFDFTPTVSQINGFTDDDEMKSISNKDMKSQLLNTDDITTKLVLAPPKKRHMYWKEMDDVEKLFGLPSIVTKTLPNVKLLKTYHRNLKEIASASVKLLQPEDVCSVSIVQRTSKRALVHKETYPTKRMKMNPVEKENSNPKPAAVPKKLTRKRIVQCLVRLPSFEINEIVWAYVRGFAYWPGVLESMTKKGKYVVHFFGDYTRAEVGRNRIAHFLEGFEQYSGHNGNAKLEKAIQEARIFLVTERTFDECMVCKIPRMKSTIHKSKQLAIEK